MNEFSKIVSDFVEQEINPNLKTWEKTGAYPMSLHKEAGDRKLLSLGLSPDSDQVDNIKYQRVLIEELTKSGAQAITMGLASHFVSLSALKFSSKNLYRNISEEVLSGRKTISLALTEPGAGSDLRGLSTLGEPHVFGDFTLNGRKKFICNGSRVDYLITAAQTSEGLSLFLVDTNNQKLITSDLDFLGWKSLPISEIVFEDTKAILLGSLGGAPKVLSNILKKERLNVAIMACASARLAYENSIRYCKNRIVNGKPLSNKQVIRHRLAEMFSEIKVTENYIEYCTNRADSDHLTQVDACIVKNLAVKTLDSISQQSVHLHGAEGCISHSIVERIYRDAKLIGIGGGSTEIMYEIISNDVLERETYE